MKVRGGLANPDVTLPHISAHILYPLVQGCETKEPKIAKVCADRSRLKLGLSLYMLVVLM